MALGFNLTLSPNSSSNGFFDSESEPESTLLSNMTDINSILTNENMNTNCFDTLGGKDIFGNPNFPNTNMSLFANTSQVETIGTVSYSSVETIGSIAFASAETIGSVACSIGGDGGFSASCGDGGGAFSSFC